MLFICALFDKWVFEFCNEYSILLPLSYSFNSVFKAKQSQKFSLCLAAESQLLIMYIHMINRRLARVFSHIVESPVWN